jgi:hypothetical protein
MKRMLDLCSGLGGASEAFVRSDEWEVIRIENNPILEHIPETIIGDIFDTTDRWERSGCPHVDLIWSSPPCLEFSLAYAAPGPIAFRAGEDYSPDLSLVIESKRIIDMIQPSTWVIENVMGSIRHLQPILGPPRMIIGSFVLWGNFPLLGLMGFAHSKFDNDSHASDPLRANKRAKVPLQISTALLTALATQTNISNWGSEI